MQPSLPLSRHTSQRLTSGRSSSPRRIVLGPGLELPGRIWAMANGKAGTGTLGPVPEVGEG